MKKLILLTIPAFLYGCGDACDKAADRMTAKYEECGIDLGDGGEGGEDVECTDELGTQSECLAGCVEAADCTILDGTSTDVDALTAYADCAAGCM